MRRTVKAHYCVRIWQRCQIALNSSDRFLVYNGKLSGFQDAVSLKLSASSKPTNDHRRRSSENVSIDEEGRDELGVSDAHRAHPASVQGGVRALRMMRARSRLLGAVARHEAARTEGVAGRAAFVLVGRHHFVLGRAGRLGEVLTEALTADA